VTPSFKIDPDFPRPLPRRLDCSRYISGSPALLLVANPLDLLLIASEKSWAKPFNGPATQSVRPPARATAGRPYNLRRGVTSGFKIDPDFIVLCPGGGIVLDISGSPATPLRCESARSALDRL
jgi:hypothetical protein